MGAGGGGIYAGCDGDVTDIAGVELSKLGSMLVATVAGPFTTGTVDAFGIVVTPVVGNRSDDVSVGGNRSVSGPPPTPPGPNPEDGGTVPVAGAVNKYTP